MSKIEKKSRRVILVIRDGWGLRKEKKDNAIALAKTPFSDSLLKSSFTTVDASSGAVGLPDGYQGNSEVGHITIGAGRIINQSLVNINESIKNKSFFKKKPFLEVANRCKKNKSAVHIIGLLQKEGVHSHLDHLYAILDFCKKEKLDRVYIHAITDGRDSPVNFGKKYLKELSLRLKKIGIGEIVTISGRYYAMDRDNRWERTELAYRAIAEGYSNDYYKNPLKKIEECYKAMETDEFIKPSVKKEYDGIKRGDAVIFFNFRTDRTRQLTKSLTDKDFSFFKRKYVSVYFVAMTKYYNDLRGKVLFKDNSVKKILGEVISKKGKKQLRISETEKYAHVTFFFNNQREKPFLNEERVLVSSPKVPTYDIAPEMSIRKLSARVIKELKNQKYDLIILNLVNADMVGHSAKIEPIISAIEAVDRETEKIAKAAVLSEYNVVITADHGNAEDQSLKWKTSHTNNPVSLSVIDSSGKHVKLKEKGGLKDVAPTILDLMKIEKPKEMIGQSLILKKN